MAEPEVAHDVHGPVLAEVVHDDEPAWGEKTDDLVPVQVGPLLAAAVVEQQVERRLGRHHLVPVALQDARVLVVAHDVVIQLTRAIIEGMDEAAAVELVHGTAYANCALTSFESGPDGPRLDRYNWSVPVREQGEPATRSEDAPVGR